MMDQLRMMEEEMQDVVSFLHPIEFMDEVGENICDVSGTCADLFESQVLILSTAAIIGSKGASAPCQSTILPMIKQTRLITKTSDHIYNKHTNAYTT